jgi:hypothetical protein
LVVSTAAVLLKKGILRPNLRRVTRTKTKTEQGQWLRLRQGLEQGQGQRGRAGVKAKKDPS